MSLMSLRVGGITMQIQSRWNIIPILKDKKKKGARHGKDLLTTTATLKGNGMAFRNGSWCVLHQ